MARYICSKYHWEPEVEPKNVFLSARIIRMHAHTYSSINIHQAPNIHTRNQSNTNNVNTHGHQGSQAVARDQGLRAANSINSDGLGARVPWGHRGESVFVLACVFVSVCLVVCFSVFACLSVCLVVCL